MKSKIKFLIISLVTTISLLSVSCKKETPVEEEPSKPQIDTSCNLSIKGGCFDSWETISQDDITWLDPYGDTLNTLNELVSLPQEIGGPGPLTTEKVSDAYKGSAAKLTTKIFSPSPSQHIVIPGMIGSTKLDIPNGTIHIGKPYAEKPLSFEGYYKYQPVNGDSALIFIMLTKYNTTLGQRDTIAFAQQIFKSQTNEYTKISLPINYYSQHEQETPDTLSLLITSSAGIDLQNLTECNGQEGSAFWIDEINFIMP